jgi:methyl-accepting chemotaxis protein
MGLRGKLALTVAAVTALVAALIGVLVHEQTARTQLESARRAVDARLLAAVEDYEMLVDGGVEVEPPELPAPLRRAVTAEPVRATYLDRTGAEPVLWAALTERTEAGQTRVLAVRESYRPQAEALAALDRTLLGAGLVAALLGSLLGLVPATIAGRRISGAARTAQRIADGELSARVRPRGRDEIARLATAVNTMAEALGARLRRMTAAGWAVVCVIFGVSSMRGLPGSGIITCYQSKSIGKFLTTDRSRSSGARDRPPCTPSEHCRTSDPGA